VDLCTHSIKLVGEYPVSIQTLKVYRYVRIGEFVLNHLHRPFLHLPTTTLGVKMVVSSLQLAVLVSVVSPALACLGYEGGVPTATASYSNSAVIEVAAGETFDGGWARYDRGSGACTEQSEGGKSALTLNIECEWGYRS
jgi:hypothetical protein